MTARTPITYTAAAEFVATAFLLIAVVGAGIAAERLSGGNVGLALLADALATSGALFVLILVFAPISGAHMNPAVSLVTALCGDLSWGTFAFYAAAQIAGAIVGVWIAHAMFELPVLQTSTHVRTGSGQWLAEIVATVALLGTIWGCLRYRTEVAAAAVASVIGAA